jgi:2-isopropylmalate synthase
MADRQKLVYDWNLMGESEPLTKKRVLLDDETLRDGLQSPTVSDPSVDDKIHLMHLMEDLGIQMLNTLIIGPWMI